MKEEIATSIRGSPKSVIWHNKEIDAVFDDIYEAWKGYGGSSPILPWEEVISMKDPDTSVGYPLCTYYQTFADLLKDYTLEDMVKEMQEAEDAIMSGSYPPAVWRPFPKVDKYSDRKVATLKFRLVSTGPLFLLSLCRRWYSVTETRLKEAIPQMFVITTPEAYNDKVVSRMTHGFTFGIDYTSFDKNSCGYLTSKTLELLDRLTGKTVPRPIYEYISLSITQPLSLIIEPDGRESLYALTSTNPSGNYFTTWVNTATHIFHNCFFMKYIMRETVADYLQDFASMVTIATGDDGVERFDSDRNGLKRAHMLCEFIEDQFSIPCKLDLLKKDGELALYQPDLMAPYLNSLLIEKEPKSYYTIPLNPKRFIPRLLFMADGELRGTMDGTLSERALGIVNELRPLILHEYLNPHLPRNGAVSSILTVAARLGIKPKSVHDSEGVMYKRMDKR